MEILAFELEFLGREPERVGVLKLMREAIGSAEVTWKDLTTLNLGRIRDNICDKMAGNSACTYLGILKAFLARYKDEDIVPCKDPGRELKARRVPSQHIALTEDEVRMIDAYTPISAVERDVKILFMRGCLTGARSSDCKKFSMDNVVGDTFTYVSQKTKTEVSMPLHSMLVKYLQVQPYKPHNRAVCNTVIQRICMRLGFDEEVTLFVGGRLQKGPKWKFCTAHTARRTLASNLALRGVPVSTIRSILGHSTEIVTSRYIVVDTRNPGDAAMAFFNGN